MADLDAAAFAETWLENTGHELLAIADDEYADFVNLARAAMRHFADSAINTFDTRPDDVYSSARIIEILQKLKEEIR